MPGICTQWKRLLQLSFGKHQGVAYRKMCSNIAKMQQINKPEIVGSIESNSDDLVNFKRFMHKEILAIKEQQLCKQKAELNPWAGFRSAAWLQISDKKSSRQNHLFGEAITAKTVDYWKIIR